MNRINLADAFNPPDPVDMATGAQQVAQGDQKVQQGAIALKEIQRQTQQHNLVRSLVQAHTVTDPATGQVATDNKAVLRDLYIKDPEAAEQYQTHVEDLQAERTKAAMEAEKARQEQNNAHAKAVGEAIAAVDETGDQDQAKSDYAGAVQSLKAQNIPIDPGDEVYSPGRVAYWKRKLVGPTETFKADSAEKLQTSKNEAAAKKVEAETERAITVAKQRGADAKEVAGIRNQGMVSAANIRAEATVQAAGIRAGGGASSDDDEDGDMIDNLADQYNLTGKLPALGQGQAALRKQILRRSTQRLKEQGLTPGDVVSNAAATHANTGSLTKNQTNADAVAQAEQTAIANGQVFLDASARLSKKRGNYSGINAVKNAYGRVTGDPDVVAMDGALKTFTSEYARVVSSSPSGAGQLSDSARKEAKDTISGNYSMAQKKRALDTLKLDMANRVKATNNQLNTIRQRARTAGSSVTPPSSAPAGAVRKVKISGQVYYQLADGSLKKAN